MRPIVVAPNSRRLVNSLIHRQFFLSQTVTTRSSSGYRWLVWYPVRRISQSAKILECWGRGRYANGSFSYTPASSFSGSDTFTYKASDGANLSVAVTVTISVTANVVVAPPTISSTFGLDNGNATFTQSANALQTMRFLDGTTSGTLTRLQICVDDTTPNGKVRLGVYADNNGAPGALLLDAGEVIVTNGWVSISGLHLSVTKGKYYWLAFNMSSANSIKYLSGQPSKSHYRVNDYVYGALPARFPAGGLTNGNQYVLRAGF
jgi:hypothetical protein